MPGPDQANVQGSRNRQKPASMWEHCTVAAGGHRDPCLDVSQKGVIKYENGKEKLLEGCEFDSDYGGFVCIWEMRFTPISSPHPGFKGVYSGRRLYGGRIYGRTRIYGGRGPEHFLLYMTY